MQSANKLYIKNLRGEKIKPQNFNIFSHVFNLQFFQESFLDIIDRQILQIF